MRGEDKHLAAWLVAGDGTTSRPAVALHTELSAVLPRAMIPSRFAWITALPLTTNGKVDKRSLPEPGPDTDEGVAARNTGEQQVAEVFAAVLRRATVPVSANFFDLGGDSLRLLQVAAELNKRGLRVDIATLYRAPTVAAIAAGLDASWDADQSPVSGPAPLLPAQAWFLRNFRGNRSYFNQSVLLRVRCRLEEAELQAALDQLLQHHDALRARIAGDERHTWQEFGIGPARAVLRVHELRDDSAPETAMQHHAELLQRSLDVDAGRMLAAALFRLPGTDALLLTISHLAVDVVSWRILIEDLSSLLAAQRDGRELRLPSKTHSVQTWAEHQARAAASPALKAERSFWAAMLRDVQAGPLPGLISARVETTLTLDADEAAAILRAGPAAEPMLLAAFARALSASAHGAPPVITLEGHGREPVAEGLDVSRTVGWFTSLFPVRFDFTALEWKAAVAEVVRVLAAVPNRGAGFGLLANASGSAARLCLPPGGASFNYVGEVAAPAEDAIFLPEAASLGAPVDPDSRALFAMDLLASIREGTLVLHLSHDPAVLPATAARQVLRAMRADILTPVPAPQVSRAPSRPYVARGADEQPLTLNPGRSGVVAAMPPLFGYGAAFRNLGEALDTASFCLFDFLEADDRINRYVRAVQREAAGRPVAVLGYSGGGNLGYAVTQALEAAGTCGIRADPAGRAGEATSRRTG